MNSQLNVLRKLHEHQQYHALIQACQSLHSAQPPVLILQLIAQLHLGEAEQASCLLESLLANADTFDDDALTDLAAVHILRGEIEQAKTLLETVLKRQPELALATARLGWCYMTLGDLEQAQEWSGRSLKQDDTRIAVWLLFARLNLQRQQFIPVQQSIDSGHRLLDEQASDMPDSVVEQFWQQLRGLQMELWLKNDELASAEHWLEMLEAENDEQLIVHWRMNLANLLAQSDEHEAAEEVIRQGLKLYPANISLLLQLAELMQVQGRSMQAIQLLRRVLGQDKDNPALWARLSQLSLKNSAPQARRAAEKSLELSAALQESDDFPAQKISALKQQSRLALAQVESDEQNFDTAEKLFRELLAVNPDHVAALRAFGQQQMLRGQIDEAIALYERVKVIDPVCGHTALINARQFPEDDITLEKLDNAARIPSLEGSVRAGILFQLAAAWEKRQDHEQAFRYAQEANELSQHFLHYDPVGHRNKCARIRYSFGK